MSLMDLFFKFITDLLNKTQEVYNMATTKCSTLYLIFFLLQQAHEDWDPTMVETKL
jgi:hypothetical protein